MGAGPARPTYHGDEPMTPGITLELIDEILAKAMNVDTDTEGVAGLTGHVIVDIISVLNDARKIYAARMDKP
tara:strand:- start:1287 stop:1502 length:216 start_codon:yes stop_codon:yes gene_type:complete